MKAILTEEGARACNAPEFALRDVEIQDWDGQSGTVIIDGIIYARKMWKDGTNDGITPHPARWNWIQTAEKN